MDLEGGKLVENLYGQRVSMASLKFGFNKMVSSGGIWSYCSFFGKGFIGFTFRGMDDALWIIKNYWFMDKSVSTLKWWHPLFNS